MSGCPRDKLLALFLSFLYELSIVLPGTCPTYPASLTRTSLTHHHTQCPTYPKGLLMLPYSYDCNDFKFHAGNGFRDPGWFLRHLRNAFDVLYEEGEEGMLKMMTIALHCRIIGRPGRFAALKEFVEYISRKEGVWVATRTEIAEAFRGQFPYRKGS